MKTKLSNIFYIVLAFIWGASVAVSCEEKEPVEKPVFEFALKNESDSDIVFDEKGSTKSISFTCGDDWTARLSSQPDGWVTLDEQSGKPGDNSLSITTIKNDGPEDRTATVRLSNGSETKIIRITQKNPDALTLSASSYEVGKEGGNIKITLKPNSSCTVETDNGSGDWLKCGKAKGSSTTNYVITVSPNGNTGRRDGTVTVSDGGRSETIRVFQAGRTPTIVLSRGECVLAYEAAVFSVEVSYKADVSCRMPDGVSWISQVDTDPASPGRFTFSVSENTKEESREAEIKFIDNENGRSESVRVIQMNRWTSAPADEMWYISSTGERIEFSNTDKIFDVSVISNTYENGVGILKMSGPVTRIRRDGFYDTVRFDEESLIVNLALPSSLKAIEQAGMNGPFKGLKDLIIPEGVTEIDDLAFMEMHSLETVTLPSSLELVGYAMFSMSPVKFFKGGYKGIIMDGMAITKYYSYIDPVTGIDYSGDWLVKASSTLVNVEIPNGINAIDNIAFADCKELESLTIPSSVKFVGADNFVSDKFGYIGGPYATADHRCYVSYGSLQAFAPAGLKSYTTPSSVTSIGSNAFKGCKEIEEIVINDEVTDIGMYAFAECPKLKSVTIPSSLKTVSYDMFNKSTSLESIYFRALVPPTLLEIYTTEFPNLKIYVPQQSIDLFRNNDSWKPYQKYLTPKEYEGLENPVYYYSTDFSARGKVKQLQAASEGNGIDIIIMGDAFSDRQIADGTYGGWMDKAMESFFSVEPYKSFRKLFNVYSIDVVSMTEGFTNGNGALGTTFGQGTYITGSVDIIKEYALKAIDGSKIDDATVIVIPNKDCYSGTCTMFKPQSEGGYASGLSIGWVPAAANYETFSTTLNHEVGGHGFAKLQDEYYYAGSSPAASDIEGYSADKQKYFWYCNFDFTTSESEVSWSKFLADPRYQNEGLGIFEGALFETGAYRPRESSIMRYNVGGYNAPSREIIYKRIMSLAYGPSWTYDYEEFVRYDAINLTPQTKSQHMIRNFIPLAPPVVVNQ